MVSSIHTVFWELYFFFYMGTPVESDGISVDKLFAFYPSFVFHVVSAADTD